MKGHTLTKKTIAAGLLRQERKRGRFWRAYYRANRLGTATAAMTAVADRLLNKQQTGVKLFNQ